MTSVAWVGAASSLSIYPFDLTQQPALSVPCGFASDKLPIGLQIVGAKYNDALVLGAGYAYQGARPINPAFPGEESPHVP